MARGRAPGSAARPCAARRRLRSSSRWSRRAGDVFEARAQRRELHHHGREAVVEVLAEAALLHLAREVAARWTPPRARRRATGRSAPTGRISRDSRARRSLACSSRGELGHLVEEERAPLGARKAPWRARCPSWGLSTPKSSASIWSRGIAPQSTAMKGPPARGPWRCRRRRRAPCPCPSRPRRAPMRSLAAMRSRTAKTSRMAAEVPTRRPKRTPDGDVFLDAVAQRLDAHAGVAEGAARAARPAPRRGRACRPRRCRWCCPRSRTRMPSAREPQRERAGATPRGRAATRSLSSAPPTRISSCAPSKVAPLSGPSSTVTRTLCSRRATVRPLRSMSCVRPGFFCTFAGASSKRRG
jgi:hypothetical protein